MNYSWPKAGNNIAQFLSPRWIRLSLLTPINPRIVLFNPAAEKMFGCTANEARGISIDRLIPEWFGIARGAHTRTFADAGSTNCQKDELEAVTGLRANGEKFPVEISLSQCEMDSKKLCTAILRDVTDRMRVASALKEQLRLQDQLTKI
ncbi:MAG: PAS domain-containing protein [Methylococcales bacterium]|nr:PAS domain-containing protein [Methylococcales bacterium]